MNAIPHQKENLLQNFPFVQINYPNENIGIILSPYCCNHSAKCMPGFGGSRPALVAR